MQLCISQLWQHCANSRKCCVCEIPGDQQFLKNSEQFIWYLICLIRILTEGLDLDPHDFMHCAAWTTASMSRCTGVPIKRQFLIKKTLYNNPCCDLVFFLTIVFYMNILYSFRKVTNERKCLLEKTQKAQEAFCW